MNSSDYSKNDRAWEQLFDKYRILENIERKGAFEIKSTQINEFREARLMTKFDQSINLPKIFSDHNLTILPVTRGSYIISSFAAYKNFEQLSDEITVAAFPDYLESIDYENITSEAIVVNCIYASHILAHFLEDEDLIPTVNGRMSSASFSFKIRNTSTNSHDTINVVNSQIEIDGGFEGRRQLALIEAKNFLSDDFLIRQLYYPYRLWSNKISKKVTPVFLVYSNGIYSLSEYEFTEPGNYNSLVVLKQKNYSIEAVDISLGDIIGVLYKVKIVKEPRIPFPQADNLKRVINLCELLVQETMTKDEITQNYAFDSRQTNYYTDAGRYLGLINKFSEDGEIMFSLTEEGRRIVRSRYRLRQLKLVETILKHRVFNQVLNLYLKSRKMPSKSRIVEVMKTSDLYQVEAESTFQRRASTVAGWVKWILDLQR